LSVSAETFNLIRRQPGQTPGFVISTKGENTAVKLIANYSKRLGLPGYSSHQFSVSVETELMLFSKHPRRVWQRAANRAGEM
jgi:hypothetical protein